LRFILLTSCLILTTSVTISMFVLWRYQVDEAEEIREKGITLARTLAYNSELGVLTRNRDLLRELIAGIFQERAVVHVAVHDASGVPLLSESREGESPDSLVALRAPEHIEVGGGTARVTALARSTSGPADVLQVAYPVFTRRGHRTNEEIGFLLEEQEASGGRLETVGDVRVSVSLEGTYSEVAHLRWAFGGLTLVVILLGVLVTVLLVRFVVRPIRSLVTATRRIAAGNLDEVVEEGSRDEIGELARSFNQMTAQLRRSLGELEKYSADLENQVRARTRELEKAQDQLVQAEKMSAVGLLVSGVAHELNNPLAGVVGYSQLLVKEEVSERVRRGLERINKEAERCKKIVQNLQTFARKHKAQKEYVGINGILESTLELRAYQMRVDNITVELDLDPVLPKTMADYHQLQQVFINILVNAHQAILSQGHGGRLAIRSSSEGGFLRVEFRDSGPGIPEEHLSRIFDPFFTTKEVGQGTGLGLSICYGIIEEHRGRIRARNAPDGGAVFTVEIPITRPEGAEAEVTAQASEPPSASRPRPGNILVVDDELTIVDILYQVLRSDGHRVDTALTGNIALRKLEKESYDVIISDLKMPGMSGQDLYEKVRAMDRALAGRIIFSTGDVVSSQTREFLERSGNLYLQKPFEIEAIRRIVMAAMESRVVDSVPALA
jgi:signal transduction histidine kinase/CheY-like chemotaxis protein